MKDRGFTLVELLAVIVIISLITVVAVPSALTFQQNMNMKMFCSKVQSIESAAKQYGNDFYTTLEEDVTGKIATDTLGIGCGNRGQCFKVNVNLLLLKKYLKKEKNNTTNAVDEFYDPRDFTSMLENRVYIYMEDNRVYSRFVYMSRDDLELCNPPDVTDSSKVLYYKDGDRIYKYEGGNVTNVDSFE